MSTAPISELAERCDVMVARDLGWFRTLGGWTRDEPDGSLQRLWATASHRHAWHAELWSERRPTIAPVPDHPSAEPAEPHDASPAGRADLYRATIGRLRAELAELDRRIDPELDPSTRRVIELVDADLAALAQMLAAADTADTGPNGTPT